MVSEGAKRAKEWRRNNPDKIKAYLERTVDRRKAYYEKNRVRIKKGIDTYYANNREEIAKKKRIKNQRTNYEYDRVESTRKNMIIRNDTRKKYPLKGQRCVKCGSLAEHRHHTTKPIEVDSFIFLCERCHNKIHGRRYFEKTTCKTSRRKDE